VDAGMGNAVITATFGSELLKLFGTEEQKQKYFPLWCRERRSWVRDHRA